MLEKLQKTFVESLYSRSADLEFISSKDKQLRFEIYRKTVFEVLRKSLELTYPGIWKLLGEECAKGVAHRFCLDREHLPTTACLDDWGKEFSSYLATVPELSALPYLENFAQYEWLKAEVYQSALGPEDISFQLEEISEEAALKGTFRFLPSVRFFSSIYPIHRMVDLIDAVEQEGVSLSEGACYGVLYKNQQSIHTSWIQEDIFHFYSSLWAGKTLGEAAEHCHENYPTFNLQDAILLMMTKKIVHAFYTGVVNDHKADMGES